MTPMELREALSTMSGGDVFFDFDNDGWADLFMVNGHVYSQVDSVNIGTRS
jgi:hypothetical protein